MTKREHEVRAGDAASKPGRQILGAGEVEAPRLIKQYRELGSARKRESKSSRGSVTMRGEGSRKEPGRTGASERHDDGRYDELVSLVRKGFHWDNLIKFSTLLSENHQNAFDALHDGLKSDDAQVRNGSNVRIQWDFPQQADLLFAPLLVTLLLLLSLLSDHVDAL